jgi:hypothetical protein
VSFSSGDYDKLDRVLGAIVLRAIEDGADNHRLANIFARRAKEMEKTQRQIEKIEKILAKASGK